MRFLVSFLLSEWPRLACWGLREVLRSRKLVRLCLAQVFYAYLGPFTIAHLGVTGSRQACPG